MQVDNLSKHGILTGGLIIIYLFLIIILAANKIHEINHLSAAFKDFNEFEENPPPSLDVPVGVVVISLIITSNKERLLFIAPWLILYSFGILGEIIFFVHQLLHYYSFVLLIYMIFILGVQLLIFSPIALIFHGIRCKNKAQHILQTNLQQDIDTNSAIPKNSESIV